MIDDNSFSSEVRTVVQVAAFLDELKHSAATLSGQIAASQRGYFTPDEEDATRALLVSYWQSRNALHELIQTCRDMDETGEQRQPAVFLTAFAASLVLIDAARFLREQVHDNRLVRRKLNEPAVEFGIPGGVYDTVQKALVSARYAWHLYYAIEYFLANEGGLREFAQGTQFDELLEIIDRLRHRLDVSVSQFARAKLKTRSSQFFRRLGRDIFGRAIYGLQKFSGTVVADKFVRRGHVPGLPAAVMVEVSSLLRPGDVLIVRKEYALTNYFLPGYWPHAALCLGTAAQLEQLGLRQHANLDRHWKAFESIDAPDRPRCLESMKDGVHVRPLSSPLASDSVVILRPQLADPEIARALSRSLAHAGKPYDFGFDFRRADRLVCTEVVYRAYDGVGGLTVPLTTRAGRPTLAGRDLIRIGCQRQGFAPIAVFAPRFGDNVVYSDEATEVMRRGERWEESTSPQAHPRG